MAQMKSHNKKLKNIFFILACAIFLITTLFALLILDDGFKVAHDGDYCIFKADNEPYDFIWHGRRCDFSWDALSEPICFFVLFHLIAQAIVWSLIYKPVVLIADYLSEIKR